MNIVLLGEVGPKILIHHGGWKKMFKKVVSNPLATQNMEVSLHLCEWARP